MTRVLFAGRSTTLLLLLLVLAGLASCDNSSKVQPPTTKEDLSVGEKPTQISFNTRMNFSSDGMMRAILRAGRVLTYETKKYTTLDSGVRVDFYDRLGQHSSTLTALRARINSINNNMTAYGQVHIVSDSGTVVDTDSLEWMNQEQSLRSEAHVRIAEKNGRITVGTGFQSDQNLTHYNIMHPQIEAPSGTFGPMGPPSGGAATGETSPEVARPYQPAVPGAGAVQTQPNFGLPAKSDTTKK